MIHGSSDIYYSDTFKEAHAKSAASALNSLCEHGRLALFSVDGEMLAFYPLKGTEFRARQADGVWSVFGVPLDYVRFIKEGVPGAIKFLSWGGETVLSVRAEGQYFEAGMEFDSFLTISY